MAHQHFHPYQHVKVGAHWLILYFNIFAFSPGGLSSIFHHSNGPSQIVQLARLRCCPPTQQSELQHLLQD
jgi:hypothetical protein